MALIICPECENYISDKSDSCIHCGYPLPKVGELVKHQESQYSMPELPSDLNVGKQLVNWGGDCATKCYYKGNGEKIFDIDFIEGKTMLILFESGIKVCLSPIPIQLLSIHKSQIISIAEYNIDELTDKSVLSRALVGGLLLGPLGAVVGGMSGIGKKNKKSYYLALEYWDINTQEPICLSFENNTSFALFIKKSKKTLNCFN